MIVKEIDGITFNKFANNHPLKNFYQTKEYGDLMAHSNFSVMFIGGFLDNSLVAASLILYKSIGPNMKYGYAPRGFLVDYYNSETLKKFTKAVKDYFLKKSFAFIKINPEITFSTVDFSNKSKLINSRNKRLVEELKKLGYDKLKDNLYFESQLPKYTPVIYLPKYDFKNLDSKVLKNAEQGELSGIRLVTGDESDISTLYSFVEDKENKTEVYYKMFYETFKKSNMVDLLLIELNYQIYVTYLQKQYLFEQDNNEKINEEFEDNPNNMDIYNKKMKSDQTLSKIQSEIALANKMMQENKYRRILGAAFVIKHQGRITILISGQTYEFKGIDIKSFMYYKIIEGYKKAGYLFFDLNGITADFSDSNPYKRLNDFKLSFKPNVYEYVGEFDLIVNKPFHQFLWSTNKIQNEFYKPAVKK